MSTHATEIKERPIIFSVDMVRAILDCNKTQTRRVIKPSKRDAEGICMVADRYPYNLYGDYITDHNGMEWPIACPYGVPGDRLWVREVWARTTIVSSTEPGREGSRGVAYRERDGHIWNTQPKWKSPRYMPRWASRITLEVTDVRVERVQQIGMADAEAEGVRIGDVIDRWPDGDPLTTAGTYTTAFIALWDRTNAKRGYSWESNPWVWAITFNQVEGAAA